MLGLLINLNRRGLLHGLSLPERCSLVSSRDPHPLTRRSPMDDDQSGWGWTLIGWLLTPLRPLARLSNWLRGYGWRD